MTCHRTACVDEQTKRSLAFALIGLYLHLERGFSGRSVLVIISPPCKGRKLSVYVACALGEMLWLSRNTLSGSYRLFTATRRSHVAPGYASRVRAHPSSPRKPI